MNILFFYCNVIAPSKGGVESWTAAMCEEFERRGHVCFYLAAKPVWKEFADPKRQYLLPNRKKFASFENANFFENLLREKHIDQILYLWADGKRFPFAEICQKSSIPVIAAIRTDPEFYLLRFRGRGLLQRMKRLLRFRRQSKIYRANATCCAVTVLLSKCVFPGFLRHFPGRKCPGMLVAIPNNCRLPGEEVDFSLKKKELLFVGRMEMAVKQPHLLLYIWQDLQYRFPDWVLRLVGGGDNVEEVRALAKFLGLKNVFFEGFKEPAPYYRSASIFCMTSAYEGFPNVLLEAANYGCVPVAFDSFSAVQDIIEDGVSGILVPPFDLEHYTDALSKLMLDTSLRVSLGSSALKNISRFSIEKIGDEWEKLFRNLNINTKEIVTCPKTSLASGEEIPPPPCSPIPIPHETNNFLFLYCNAIAPSKGGVERWAAAMCEEFECRGHACVYLAARPAWKEFADPKRQYFLPNEKRFASPENADFFEKLLKEKRIDQILYLWADGKRFPFAEICRRYSIPVVAAVHTDPEFYLTKYRGNGIIQRTKRFLRFRRQAKIYRANARCCSVTVLLSERVFPGFLRHFSGGKFPGRLFAISNICALSGEAVDFSLKKKELLFVGRMDMPVKQPHLLLRIWQILQDRFPDWTLRFVGGGVDLEKVKALANSLGVKNVFFEGFQDPEPYYRSASIFCLTSAFEGFGMVLVEAQTFGCVPVAFDSFGAVHDTIDDGVSGVLVPAFDLDAYAEKLSSLMLDSTLRERLALNAQKSVAKFSSKKIGDEWEKLFRELNSENGRQRSFSIAEC